MKEMADPIAHLLAASVAWLAPYPLLAWIAPRSPRRVLLDWYQFAGYTVVAASAIAIGILRGGHDLSAPAGREIVALVYGYFGFLVATSVLMLRAAIPLRSILVHHAAFGLVTVVIILGDYWVEMYVWLLASQFTGAAHSASRLVQREPDCSPEKARLAKRVEWFMLLGVRGVLAAGVTVAFAYEQFDHPTYGGAGWIALVASLTAAMVGFPLFWAAPALAARLRAPRATEAPPEHELPYNPEP